MNNIDWEELFNDRMNVFHCENEKLANELLSIAHNLGHKWVGGGSYLDYNNWQFNKENTCYWIYHRTYEHIEEFLSRENRQTYNIINVKELLYGRKPFKLNRK